MGLVIRQLQENIPMPAIPFFEFDAISKFLSTKQLF